MHRDSTNYSLYFCIFLQFPGIKKFSIAVKERALKTDYILNVLPLLKNHQEVSVYGKLTIISYLRVRMYFVTRELLNVRINKGAC